MSNVIHSNAKMPAFKKFLSGKEGFASSEDAKEFEKFSADYANAARERAKYLSPEAQKAVNAIRERAHDNPTEANLAALAECSPEEIFRRYEHAANEISEVMRGIMARATPMLARLYGSALPVIEAEIARVEAENRAQFEQYGAAYDPGEDVLLNCLKRWRRAVTETRDTLTPKFHPDGREMNVPRQMHQPEQVQELLGTIRARKALFGLL